MPQARQKGSVQKLFFHHTLRKSEHIVCVSEIHQKTELLKKLSWTRKEDHGCPTKQQKTVFRPIEDFGVAESDQKRNTTFPMNFFLFVGTV